MGSFEEVCGLRDIQVHLEALIRVPRDHPSLFENSSNDLIKKGALFMGVPGVGKSLIVKKIAAITKYQLMTVSSSSIYSKYYGESEQQILRIFQTAKENRPVIIFFDEIDGLGGKRSSDDADQLTKRIFTEILLKLSQLQQEEDNDVIVFAATNLPWTLDPAMIRRFPSRIHFPLPSEEDRVSILKMKIGQDQDLSDGDFKKLGIDTRGYSCSDIVGAIADAKNYYHQQAVDTKHCLQKEDGTFEPCSSSTKKAIPMTYSEIPKDKLYRRKLCYRAIKAELAKSPTVTRWQEKRMIRFAADYATRKFVEIKDKH
jgi:vacuolar protein-sorting-associated protein 4